MISTSFFKINYGKAIGGETDGDVYEYQSSIYDKS